MRQFLGVILFISILNLYMQKNGAVWGKIRNMNNINLRNEMPKEEIPSEDEFPTSAQEGRDEDSTKDVMKETSEETKEFTDEVKESKNKESHESLKTMNQHTLKPVEISLQDSNNVNGKNEEVKDEVQMLEVEDDVDEEEEEDDDEQVGEADRKGENDHHQQQTQEGQEAEKIAQEGKDASPNDAQANRECCQPCPNIEEYFKSTEGPLKDLIKLIIGDKELENRINDIIKIMVLFFLQL
ncbi:conserved Plasmodium protein, unknown function [Plasmodium knowlesi strain H]|uniref:Merozoite surface protein 3 n=3 Tax=Plasmodium knowlesi TaxID=5850 RepID=A0A5K1UJB6_PLAKH|nr:conserved Plasmodium protein, unknown function [Plasmodium knowlesi strain H]OTN67083.1 Uncharacterized protein PKNOH_S07468400 [Plasmodium knowlesi]CAA9988808.1 conserved Plasmodium protein, unknown function [Plasmodium knowlesi strain H]SBO21800.1 conserved Plasmodium protein, unknown function [Plasmodium knowlesi strain H]SBO22175.1 conserved Plasmodium protein, unknown function [Plasmodium knowlesi strain H]VVS78282.1 conserved Plasmodium protein, unknown function [Plasmodium knowlesi s|eukprot:XP_002259787.1 hypothetical protein, conserved in Plasmodium species [Plasmodium knowlesi strain H]